jgi:hypothetical protein
VVEEKAEIGGELVRHITIFGEATLVVLGVLGAVWLGIKKIYSMAKNIESLVSQSGDNNTRLKHIEKQMVANGGGSLRDVVMDIQKRVWELEHPAKKTIHTIETIVETDQVR